MKSELISEKFNWNSKIAYAIGLLVTDGSLSNDNRHITLVSTDMEILENFQKCLPFRTEIYLKPPAPNNVKTAYRIQFSNVKFYKWLTEIGLFQNKTYTISDIKVPDKYFRDFLRGHLDGDGSVFTYNDSYNKNRKYTYERIYTSFNSVSKNHIEWLSANIQRLFNIKGACSCWKSKDRTVAQCRIRFAKADSIKLYHKLYYDEEVLCLKRKRNKFENFLKNN